MTLYRSYVWLLDKHLRVISPLVRIFKSATVDEGSDVVTFLKVGSEIINDTTDGDAALKYCARIAFKLIRALCNGSRTRKDHHRKRNQNCSFNHHDEASKCP